MDDYGLTKNSLNAFMLVQAADTVHKTGDDANVSKGKPKTVTVECIVVKRITNAANTGNNSSTTINASASVSVKTPFVSGIDNDTSVKEESLGVITQTFFEPIS
jgi:hypothetical protein